MSVLAFTGAELGSTADLFFPSGIVLETAVVHGGKYSFRISSGGSGTLAFVEHTTPVYFRGYFRYPVGLAALTRILEWRDGGGAVLVGIELRSDTLTIQAVGSTGGAGAGFGVTAMAPDVWHRLEVMLDQATGSAEVRVDRKQEIVSTTLGIPSAIGQAVLMSTSGNVYWDDVHVTEDGWPGPGFVIVRQGRPGTPTYNDFTKVGGTIDVIWSETPTNAATNATSTAVSQTQTMLVEAMSQPSIGAKYGTQFIAPRDVVLGVQVYGNGKRVGATPEQYLVRVNNGVITRSGPYNFSTIDTSRGTEIFPATLAELDAMEIGGARGEVSLTSNLQLNEAWLMVSYATTPAPIRAFTGFETGSLTEVTSPLGLMAIDTAVPRSGVYSLRMVGPTTSVIINPDPIEADTAWLRAYIFFDAFPTANQVVLTLRDANGYQVNARILVDGKARLSAGATLIATTVPVFVLGAWNYIELFKRATTVAGDGYAAMWVNDIQLTLPIIETGGATVAALCEARFATFICWFDDVMLSETGQLGQGRILARQGLSGVPIDGGWAKTGGAIDVVWDNTPSNPASYAQAVAGVATAQTMAVSPQANGGVVLLPSDTIIACRMVAMARYDAGVSGGPASLRYRAGSLLKDVAVPITSTVSRLVYGDVFAMTQAILNTIQIGGAQAAPGGPSLMRIEDIWLMVAYADLQILNLPLPSVPAPVAIVEIEL